MLDWDAIADTARTTGQAILVGSKEDYTTAELRAFTTECDKRHLCLSMGNPERNPSELKTDIYVMAKLGDEK